MMPFRCKIYAAVLLVLALGAGVWLYGKMRYTAGYDARDAIAKADEARISGEAETELAKATTLAMRREQGLKDDLAKSEDQRQQEKTAHEKAMSDLLARVRAGDERLRVAVSRGSVCSGAAAADTAATGRPGDEARADLMPATTDALFGIAGGIAGLVRDYNAVVEQYNRARETCNAVAAPAR